MSYCFKMAAAKLLLIRIIPFVNEMVGNSNDVSYTSSYHTIDYYILHLKRVKRVFAIDEVIFTLGTAFLVEEIIPMHAVSYEFSHYALSLTLPALGKWAFLSQALKSQKKVRMKEAFSRKSLSQRTPLVLRSRHIRLLYWLYSLCDCHVRSLLAYYSIFCHHGYPSSPRLRKPFGIKVGYMRINMLGNTL